MPLHPLEYVGWVVFVLNVGDDILLIDCILIAVLDLVEDSQEYHDDVLALTIGDFEN